MFNSSTYFLYLDKDPIKCAACYSDDDLNLFGFRMSILLNGLAKEYKYTKISTPHYCILSWVREKTRHTVWTIELYIRVMQEYKERFGKDHISCDAFSNREFVYAAVDQKQILAYCLKYFNVPLKKSKKFYAPEFPIELSSQIRVSKNKTKAYREFYSAYLKTVLNKNSTKKDLPDWIYEPSCTDNSLVSEPVEVPVYNFPPEEPN